MTSVAGREQALHHHVIGAMRGQRKHSSAHDPRKHPARRTRLRPEVEDPQVPCLSCATPGFRQRAAAARELVDQQQPGQHRSGEIDHELNAVREHDRPQTADERVSDRHGTHGEDGPGNSPTSEQVEHECRQEQPEPVADRSGPGGTRSTRPASPLRRSVGPGRRRRSAPRPRRRTEGGGRPRPCDRGCSRRPAGGRSSRRGRRDPERSET